MGSSLEMTNKSVFSKNIPFLFFVIFFGVKVFKLMKKET